MTPDILSRVETILRDLEQTHLDVIEMTEKLRQTQAALDDESSLRIILTKRMDEFQAIWKKAHPDREDVWPDVAAAFEAVAEYTAGLVKNAGRDQDVLREISHIAGDDFCEDLDMRSDDLTGDLKEAHEKLSRIYRYSHSARRDSLCYRRHDLTGARKLTLP